MTPVWTTFAGASLLLTAGVVGLARASTGVVTGEGGAVAGEGGAVAGEGGAVAGGDESGSTAPAESGLAVGRRGSDEPPGPSASAPGSGALLANVVLTQGVFGALLAGAAWYARLPPAALGLGGGAFSRRALGLGLLAGLLLAGANEGFARVAAGAGVRYSDALREALAPESAVGWVALLGVALPAVAAFEEALFRGALVGALAAGFALPPAALAVASSAVFGLAHGAQGRGGMAVAGVLGAGLAATYLWTGSLPAAVVAHYAVNALEFAVHEGDE